MKQSKSFGEAIVNILGFTLLIGIILILSPVIIAAILIFRIKDHRKLKKLLAENDGKILFLYGEYHEFDFLTYFETHHSEIKCLEVPNHYMHDDFMRHITKGRKAKSLPQLVKIDGKNIIVKEHYNSFKHYIRRNDNSVPFFELIESSVKNLEKL